MAKNRSRRDANAQSPRFVSRPVHRSPLPEPRLTGPGFTSPQRVVRPAPQPMADRRFYVPPTARPAVVQYSGVQRAQKKLRDQPRRPALPPALRVKASPGKRPRKLPPVSRAAAPVFVDRQTKALPVFAEPERIPLCKARSIRKRVLHAFQIAGGRVGRPRRTEQSELHCG